MPPGTRFDWHTHEDHQLAWAASGVLTVLTGEVEGSTWVLPPTRALWIPAGLPHETASDGRATMRSLYIRPGLSPVKWTDPTPVAASPLLAELIGYLGEPGLSAGHRAHAEILLADLLTPVPVTTIGVRLPSAPPKPKKFMHGFKLIANRRRRNPHEHSQLYARRPASRSRTGRWRA